MAFKLFDAVKPGTTSYISTKSVGEFKKSFSNEEPQAMIEEAEKDVYGAITE